MTQTQGKIISCICQKNNTILFHSKGKILLPLKIILEFGINRTFRQFVGRVELAKPDYY